MPEVFQLAICCTEPSFVFINIPGSFVGFSLDPPGVGQALPLRIRREAAAIGAERSGISRLVTARRPLAGAVLHDPGSGKPYPFSKQSLMPVVIDGLRAE